MIPRSLRPEDFGRRTAVGFIVLIWILAPYALLQQFSIYDVIILQEQAWDRWIPFTPHAIYIYLSYGALLAIAGYYTPPRTFIRFLKAVCLIALISHLTFFFFPSGLARPEVDPETAPTLYQWLVQWDKPRNCLPSLHASLAALAAMALWKKNALIGTFASLWAAAIFWSAIALRQHISLDLAAGLILAASVWYGVRHWAKVS